MGHPWIEAVSLLPVFQCRSFIFLRTSFFTKHMEFEF